jgi:hypothetical protein
LRRRGADAAAFFRRRAGFAFRRLRAGLTYMIGTDFPPISSEPTQRSERTADAAS